MAGDWIKVRCDLIDDPAVIGVAAALGMDEFAVVGRLIRLWSWANLQTSDGNARSVTETWLDRYLCAPGFARALAAQGWLAIEDKGVQIPKFDKHNGKPAKQRALTSSRVSARRGGLSRKCNAGSVTESATGALPEKRREESIEEDKTPLPPKGEEAPDKPAPTPRPTVTHHPTLRGALFDAVVAVTACDPKTAGSHVGRVVRALLSAEPPYTPEEVRRLPAVIASQGWNIAITPATVEKYVGWVRTPPERTAGALNGTPHPAPRKETTREKLERLARENEARKQGGGHG